MSQLIHRVKLHYCILNLNFSSYNGLCVSRFSTDSCACLSGGLGFDPRSRQSKFSSLFFAEPPLVVTLSPAGISSDSCNPATLGFFYGFTDPSNFGFNTVCWTHSFHHLQDLNRQPSGQRLESPIQSSAGNHFSCGD